MAIVKRFNVNREQVTLDSDIIENMSVSANEVSYDDSFQYDENTVGDKLSELEKNTTKLKSELNKTVIESDSEGEYEYYFSSGSTYIIINNGNEFTISHRVEKNSESHDIKTIKKGFNLYNVTSNGNWLRHGAAIDIVIYKIGSIYEKTLSSIPYKERTVVPIFGAIRNTEEVDLSKIFNEGKHAIVEVRKYDVITFSLDGGRYAFAYTIYNKEWNEVVNSGPDVIYNNQSLMIEQDGYVIFNSSTERFNVSILSYYESLNIEPQIFDSSTDGMEAVVLKKGESYSIKNIGNNIFTCSLKQSRNGDSKQIKNIVAGGTYEFICEDNYAFIRHGSAAKFTLSNSETISTNVSKLVDNAGKPFFETPSLRFDFTKDFLPTSVSVVFDTTILDQIYTKFDELMATNSNYITRVDAASLVDVSYPTYARLNGSSSGSYLKTPSYNMYMYKLSDGNGIMYNDSKFRKRSCLIFCGIHGNEIASPYNAYLFAKNLCESSNSDYYKLRAAFDFYIIPCVNGYGMYHNTRVNANGVNLNRNFPIKNWVKGGVGTVDFTGNSPNSEFETKVITALCKENHYDFVVDHHNYAVANYQFYTNMGNPKYLHSLFRSIVDCSYSFMTNLPEYFGGNYKLYKDTGFFYLLDDGTEGTSSTWLYENNIDGMLIEVSQCLNYYNGESGHSSESYTDNVFKVSEFTLRNIITHMLEYIMGGN